MPTNCPCCNEPVTGQGQDSFKCDACKTRTHTSCVGLSADDAIRLTRSKAKSAAIKTYCTPCAGNLDNYSKLAELITNLKVNLESRIIGLVEKVEQLEKSRVLTEISPDTQEMIINEAVERISRSKNIIIFNVPEDSNPQAQQQNDTAKVIEIISTLQVSNSNPPASVRRIGRAGDNRPRMLKVSFSSQEQVREILRKKKSLASSHLSSYSIQDDKTPKQQEYLRSVRSELRKRMEEEGETDLTIKYIKGIPTIISTKN